jgi:hypothetical protein
MRELIRYGFAEHVPERQSRKSIQIASPIKRSERPFPNMSEPAHCFERVERDRFDRYGCISSIEDGTSDPLSG